jgi:hypothetical protein
LDNRAQIDFLGIGAHAAGSTWLWKWMAKHPDIGFLRPGGGRGIPGKEVHYWNRFADESLEWYLEQFDWDHQVVGEITPAYARLDSEVLNRIHAEFPDLEIFYMIREPLSRTWSDVRKRVRKARFWRASNRMKYLIEQASRPKVAIRNDYVGTVKRWSEVFGADKVHVFLSSDIRERPRQVLHRVCTILGVDPAAYDGIADEELGSRVNKGLDKECPPEFVQWFETQDLTPWEEQVRQIGELGLLELTHTDDAPAN